MIAFTRGVPATGAFPVEATEWVLRRRNSEQRRQGRDAHRERSGSWHPAHERARLLRRRAQGSLRPAPFCALTDREIHQGIARWRRSCGRCRKHR